MARFLGLVVLFVAVEAQVEEMAPVSEQAAFLGNKWQQKAESARCARVEAAYGTHQEAATKCGGSAAAPNNCFCGESGALLGLSYARLSCGLEGARAAIGEHEAALQACNAVSEVALPILQMSANVVVAPVSEQAASLGNKWQQKAESARCATIEAAYGTHQEAATKCGGSAAAPNHCFCGESGALLGLSYARLSCGLDGARAAIGEHEAALQACHAVSAVALPILQMSANVVVPPLELSEAANENTSENPYMHNGPTAEALALIFIAVAIVICWIECCGAGKK